MSFICMCASDVCRINGCQRAAAIRREHPIYIPPPHPHSPPPPPATVRITLEGQEEARLRNRIAELEDRLAKLRARLRNRIAELEERLAKLQRTGTHPDV